MFQSQQQQQQQHYAQAWNDEETRTIFDQALKEKTEEKKKMLQVCVSLPCLLQQKHEQETRRLENKERCLFSFVFAHVLACRKARAAIWNWNERIFLHLLFFFLLFLLLIQRKKIRRKWLTQQRFAFAFSASFFLFLSHLENIKENTKRTRQTDVGEGGGGRKR